MKKITIYIVLAVFCPNLKGYAQDKSNNITALKIGDRVPDITIDNITGYKTADGRFATTVKISNFKGKLLILDFWATWCAPCVAMIPKMDSLQQIYKGKVQFISVTDQSQKVVETFFLNREKRNIKSSLPNVTDDRILRKIFPNTFVPHYVWINPSGVVVAFTSAYYLNSKNIEAALDSGKLNHYIPKYDIDVSRPLFSGPYFPEKNIINYKVFIKGHMEGTGAGAHPRRNAESVGMAWTNIDIGDMYMRCGLKMIKGFSPKNVILDVHDSSDLIQEKVKTNQTEWFRAHEYSVDVIIPIAQKDSLYAIMLSEINCNTRYTGSIESRKVKVLALKVIGDTARLYSKAEPYKNTLSASMKRQLQNAPALFLANWLNYNQKNLPPVIDDTGLTRNINCSLSSDARDFLSIKRDLNKQGLDLLEKEERIDMLVIKEKTNH